MHLVLSSRSERGGGFRSPLRAAHKAAMEVTRHVQAAVAYVSTEANPVLADCDRAGIRCEVWSRHDETLPTSLRVMDWACRRMKLNGNLTWKLVARYFHPKVIWWHGYGVYIGSANFTDAAWNSNCEAGVVILESELGEDRATLASFFDDLDAESEPLTPQVYAEAQEAFAAYEAQLEALRREMAAKFAETPTGKQLAKKSLSEAKPTNGAANAKTEFLREWNTTLDRLRFVQARLSEPGNRPAWVPADVSPGIHTDQFLHAFYYTRVREGQSYPVEKYFEQNRSDPVAALAREIEWWRNTASAPSSEDLVFRDWAPVHRELLTSQRLASMTEAEFVRVARRTHSIKNFAKRQRRTDVLDEDEIADTPDTERKCDLFCEQLYYRRNLLNWQTPQLLKYLLFGGPVVFVPERLFECVHRPHKIPGLDLSSLGELIGCGLPNDYPPRNDRTNKALRAVGWPIHVRSPNRE